MNQNQNRLRVIVVQELDIAAPAAEAFPLACPVRELEWIDQWKFELIFSESGYNENNCNFTETMSFPFLFERSGKISWYTTRYDAEAFRVEFLLVCESLALIKWEIAFMAKGENACRARWNITLTSRDPEVDAIGEKALSERLSGIIEFLGQALKYYCETGKCLRLNQAV